MLKSLVPETPGFVDDDLDEELLRQIEGGDNANDDEEQGDAAVAPPAPPPVPLQIAASALRAHRIAGPGSMCVNEQKVSEMETLCVETGTAAEKGTGKASQAAQAAVSQKDLN